MTFCSTSYCLLRFPHTEEVKSPQLAVDVHYCADVIYMFGMKKISLYANMACTSVFINVFFVFFLCSC